MKNELSEDKQLSLAQNRHQPKAEGAFLASAAADALGWPQEMRGKKIHPRETITQTEFSSWVRLEGGRFYRNEQKINAGEYSDDTQLMLAVARCRTLTTSSWWNTFTRTELPLWSLYQRGGGASTKRSVRSWLRGVPPWEGNESGQLASYFNAGGNGVAMRILPHAIYFAGGDDPSQLIRDIFLDGISTHGHPRALVGAVVYGFAAWWFLRSQETVGFGEIIDVLLRHVDSWGVLPDPPSSDNNWSKAAATAFQGAYSDNWSVALEEMVGLLHSVKTGLNAGAISNDEAVLREIGAYGLTKGAGTITAAAALYLAARYAAQPAQGVLRAAFGHGTDTDTIGAMVGGLAGCLAGKDWIPQAWYRVQDCEYLLQLATLVAQGPDQQVSQRQPPVVVGRRQVDAIRRALTDEKKPNLMLDGIRRAKVVSISQPRPVSNSNTVRTWSLRAEDGQTMYVDIQSRIPEALRQTRVGGQAGATEELRTRGAYEHKDKAERDDRLRLLIRKGAGIAGGATGSAVGTVVGSLLAGPGGVAEGGTIGAAATTAVKAIGYDFSSRLLSPREQARVGGVYTLAAAEIIGRSHRGERVRNDGFFETKDTDRSDAEEVWESMLLKSQKEPEEKKLPYMAHFLANLAFDTQISAAMAHQITKIADSMTYRQLCILQLSATKDRFELRKHSYEGQDSFCKDSYQIIYEYYNLYHRGLINFGTTLAAAPFDVNPGAATLQALGLDIYHELCLSRIPDDDLVPIAAHLH